MKKLNDLIHRHAQAGWYALTVIVPVILRTRRRPVMFSKYSGIGDIICTFPAVLKLKERHPQATFIYNCHRPYACLPRMAGVTDFVTDLLQTGVLRYWYPWLFSAFYEFPSADELPNDFCKQYLVKEYAANHGADVVNRHPLLQFSPAAAAKAAQLLTSEMQSGRPIIIFHGGPTWPVKEWPQAAWSNLVQALRERGYSNLIQVGTNHHLSLGSVGNVEIQRTKSLINQLTLEETVAVISRADLFVGVDSGLIHLAAALQVPSVGIFGPTKAEIILPPSNASNSVVSRVECQGCHHRVPRIHWETGCPHDIVCMKSIPVAEVLAACLRLLPQRPVG